MNANNLNLSPLGGCIWPHRARASKLPHIAPFNRLKPFFLSKCIFNLFPSSYKMHVQPVVFFYWTKCTCCKKWYWIEKRFISYFLLFFLKNTFHSMWVKKKVSETKFGPNPSTPPIKKSPKKIQSNFTLENWTYMF